MLPPPPFEGNLIRAREYAPCGCREAPHWVVDEQADGSHVGKACPGRMDVEPFVAEDGEVLGYRLLKPSR